MCFGLSSSNCTRCNELYVLSGQSCVSTCSNTTFNSSGICVPCQSPCLTCLDSKNCSSCQSPLYLNGNACVISCPIGTYNLTFSCITCPSTCTNCFAGASTILCKSCSAGFFLENGTCNSNCSITNFKNLVEFRCDPCNSPC